MGTGYQEEKEEQYKKMMEEIAGHPDFGKRNPVDIGMECGYLEQDVMEMIQFLYDSKKKQELKPRQKSKSGTCYVVMEIKGDNYIVSVDVNKWEGTVMRKIPPIARGNIQIRGSIFAYVQDGRKTIFWEDLDNGEKGKFSADGEVTYFLILEDGIAAETCKGRGTDAIVKFSFHGGEERMGLRAGNCGKLVEGKDKIYVVSASGISIIDKGLKHKNDIICGEQIVAVECVDDEICWYTAGNGKNGPSIKMCKKYSEKNPYHCETRPGSEFGITGKGLRYGLFQVARTRNYRFSYRRVYDINAAKEVCYLDRNIDYEHNSVISIFEKDVFIAVVKYEYEENESILKIDMNRELNPVVLPVYMNIPGRVEDISRRL